MKTIQNQNVAIELPGVNGITGEEFTKIDETSYAKLIFKACNRASNPQQGFTYDDIENIAKVKQAISEEKEGEIHFEDSVFKFVKERVQSMSWGVASMELVKLRNYIKSIE